MDERAPAAATDTLVVAMSAAEQAAAIMQRYREVRTRFGMDRLQLGVLLQLIREHALWRGEAASFEAFLAAENLNAQAARQYMRVARKYIVELAVPPALLQRLACAGMTALDRAARHIDADNRDEMLAALAELSERDAIERVRELAEEGEALPGSGPPRPVLALLRQYYELPPDLRQQFMLRVQERRGARAEDEDVPADAIAQKE